MRVWLRVVLMALLLFSVSVIIAQEAPPAGDDDDDPIEIPGEEPPAVEDVDALDLPLPITSDYTYTVRERDNLDAIAALFDVSVDCLRETNEIAPSELLRPGDTVLISADCPFYVGGDVVEFPRPDAPGRAVADGMYLVQRGDTLDEIAQQFDVSLDALRAVNDIQNASREVVPGLELTIPEDAPPYGQSAAVVDAEGPGVGGGLEDGELYVVQIADTLDTIAQAFNVSVNSLIDLNEIDNPKYIFPGEQLFIPDDAPPYSPFEPVGGLAQRQQPEPEPEPDLAEGGGVGGGVILDEEGAYIVQVADTLDTIAQEFNVAVQSLIDANDIDNPQFIFPGETLIIPEDAPPYGTVPPRPVDDEDLAEGGGVGGGLIDGDQYVVQIADTIDEIAAAADLDVACVMEANAVEDGRDIFPGDILVLPTSCPQYIGFTQPQFEGDEDMNEDPVPVIPPSEPGEAPPSGETDDGAAG